MFVCPFVTQFPHNPFINMSTYCTCRFKCCSTVPDFSEKFTFCKKCPKFFIVCILWIFIVCIALSVPLKNTPLFLAKPPLKFENCPSPPSQAIPPYILVFREPHPKNWIFQCTLIILKFFILNSISSLKSN